MRWLACMYLCFRDWGCCPTRSTCCLDSHLLGEIAAQPVVLLVCIVRTLEKERPRNIPESSMLTSVPSSMAKAVRADRPAIRFLGHQEHASCRRMSDQVDRFQACEMLSMFQPKKPAAASSEDGSQGSMQGSMSPATATSLDPVGPLRTPTLPFWNGCTRSKASTGPGTSETFTVFG